MSRCTHTHGRTLCFECFRTGIGAHARAARRLGPARAAVRVAGHGRAPAHRAGARAPPPDAGVLDRDGACRQSGVEVECGWPAGRAATGLSSAPEDPPPAAPPPPPAAPCAPPLCPAPPTPTNAANAWPLSPLPTAGTNEAPRHDGASDRRPRRRKAHRDRERQPLSHRGIRGRRLPIPRDISQILPEGAPVLGAPHRGVRQGRVRDVADQPGDADNDKDNGISIGHGP